jgi:phage tail sheath protein FI
MAQVSYPGVYVQEIPSGVRTIVGVSTSVTAFIGTAKRGPINNATEVLSFADYERKFGGLSRDSEVSYAVRQFFQNGGSRAYVVRLAKNPLAASLTLTNGNGDNVIALEARDQGLAGNSIRVQVDYDSAGPLEELPSNFNLTLSYVSPDNPTDTTVESFADLSMNSNDARYAVTIINADSDLVEAERVADLAGLGAGTSVSGEISDVEQLIDDTHSTFRVSANGSVPLAVVINPNTDISGATPEARLTFLADRLQTKIQSDGAGVPALAGMTVGAANGQLTFTSAVDGEDSTVRILPGLRNDASSRLRLGANGGTETDAVAAIRPAEAPDHAELHSGNLAMAQLNSPDLPDATAHRFNISVDGYGPDLVDIGTTAATGNTAARLEEIGELIETAVRALKPNNSSYADFTCRVSPPPAPRRLILASGGRGPASSVSVTPVAGDDLAAALRLIEGVDGAAHQSAADVSLQGGNEEAFNAAEAYGIYIGSQTNREGIYALDGVDLFNIMCLPGISDPGILMDAESYCRDRRAFLIIDAPQNAESPAEMRDVVSGTDLPKSNHAAVYYPWISIADPLNGGRPRMAPPSGTIAGLYARTDSTRGVWKAPAGIEATLGGVQGAAYHLTDNENGTLNPLGVNCLRVFPVTGAVSWGARTLRGADQLTDEYKYVPVRRLALFIEETLYRNTHWVVFEPNDEPLWAQIRLNIGAFMHDLFRQGAFQGAKPRDAYLVKCDSETTTQNDINQGIVNILVGFAPLKPAEFVIIRIQQLAGQIQA